MNIETRMDATQYNTVYGLIDVTTFLLQSSFKNPIKFYYIWIAVCVLAIVDLKRLMSKFYIMNWFLYL
jgi:hypothetical protein